MAKQTAWVRLVDIAEQTGFSQTVVGKVLNGGSNAIRVSEQTRKAILAAAREMNYQPNLMASGLRKKRSNLIGILLDTYAGRRHMILQQELERVAEQHNYRILTSFTHDNAENMYRNYQTLLNYGVAGVICLAHDYPDQREAISAIFAGEKNIVFMEKPFWQDAPYVSFSKEEAFTELIAAGIRRGRPKVALIHAALRWQTERLLHADYCKALAANGLEFDPALVFEYDKTVTELPEICRQVISRLLEPIRPDLLLVDSAEHALTLQSMLQYRGWKLPEELTIFGGNNDRFFRCATPEIRSLDPDYHRIAEALLSFIVDHDHFVSGKCIQARCPEKLF